MKKLTEDEDEFIFSQEAQEFFLFFDDEDE